MHVQIVNFHLEAMTDREMRYLYERPGQLVDRASLLREVWGTDYAGGSNVIEVHVASLRRKLGDRSAVIETVRGTGYRFAPSA